MSTTPKLAIHGLCKSFGENRVLRGLDLQVMPGESLVVIGGSGTGKSVLLKCILGLLHPEAGSIEVDGEEVVGLGGAELDRVRRKFGMLFQNAALFDSLTVWRNVAFGLTEGLGMSPREAKPIALETLAAVGLDEEVAELWPAELSGGMRKRVGLARAIATKPEILFFDEPTTGLDPIMGDVIDQLIVKTVREVGATALSITHDMASAKRISDRIAMLHLGRGARHGARPGGACHRLRSDHGKGDPRVTDSPIGAAAPRRPDQAAPAAERATEGPGPAPPHSPLPTARRYDRSIVEGPLRPAVWKLAWPTMLVNVIGGLQGMIDHVLVGHLIGYEANAAIGVAWQIYLVVAVFIGSLFTGMSVLVARFAGANDEAKVDRTVYQAFLTAAGISLLVLAPAGYVLSPPLLDLVNAAPPVKAQALPFLRIMFLFGAGLHIFLMVGAALRSAGDARTPMVLGIAMTALNLVFNVIFIRGLGPIPGFGTAGAALGTVIASGLVAAYALARLWSGGWVVSFPRQGFGPDWTIIRALFRFGLPAGIQGIVMNIGGVLMLGFIGSLAQSAAAQAAFAVSYSQLFSLVTWTALGLMGAAAAVAGQNLGAARPERTVAAVGIAARIGLTSAAVVSTAFLFFPRHLLAVFGMNDPEVVALGVQLLRVLSVSGLFVTVALAYTGGLQGTGDTRSPLYISIVSQVVVPLGTCFVIQQTGGLDPIEIWLSILAGHVTRCALSVGRFNQGRWRGIALEISPKGE